MVFRDGLWWSMTVRGSPWQSRVGCGGPWQYTEFRDGLWWTVVVHGGLWWPTAAHGGPHTAPECGGHQRHSHARLPWGAHAHEVPILFSVFPVSETKPQVPKAEDCLIAKKCFSTSWGAAT